MAKTILIVEDNKLNMRLFNSLFLSHGYETIQSTDGSDALEIARERRPDLIVMDIQLPECSGIELTKLLKADQRIENIPVIAVTAFAMEGDEKVICEAGCNEYIPKPISIPFLLDAVTRLLA